MRFGESVSNNNEGKIKNLHDPFTKLRIEPNNNEEKTHFGQSTSSNKRDKFDKSPEQSVKLRMKYKHTEDISGPDEMSTNDIESYSCDSDLFATKNWQGKFEVNEFGDHSLDLDINDVSYFIDTASNDIEVYLDESDLLAVKN
ncbi:aspartyl-trna synthetase [Lasius niger]|uniref:Aspartyl-trna synthetase n=1 Tax=Lasius niger TaxID=67767 RepID=A0A0J7K9U8_LASNI|nr:aspartyl-trna synthetase [Lasius niger]